MPGAHQGLDIRVCLALSPVTDCLINVYILILCLFYVQSVYNSWQLKECWQYKLSYLGDIRPQTGLKRKLMEPAFSGKRGSRRKSIEEIKDTVATAAHRAGELSKKWETFRGAVSRATFSEWPYVDWVMLDQHFRICAVWQYSGGEETRS